MNNLVLRNDLYLLEFDAANGALIRLRDEAAGCEVITEPRLADSFRLLLPLPDMHANYVLGSEQALTSWQVSASHAVLHWAGPLKNGRGAWDLDVTLRVELAGEAVVFQMEVANRSAVRLTEVWQASIGGMTGLGGDEATRRRTEAMLPVGQGHWNRDVFINFGTRECLGLTNAEQRFAYPLQMSMPWLSLHNRQTGRALYCAALEKAPRTKLVRLALMPGVAHDRKGGDWLRPDEVGGQPIGLTMNWVNVPHTPPGQTFVGPRIVLQSHAGDWRQSAALYRQWFESEFPVVDSRKQWIRQETAYLDTMFLLPEDNVNLTFGDMAPWAAAAKRAGLKALLVSGWHRGGHDRGYPMYEPDPRLGTWEDLRRAIAQCHNMGMKVFFFVNFDPVDEGTPWFQSEGKKYLALDWRGFDFGPYGWGMGTLSARANMTRTGLVNCNPLHRPFRDLLVGYFRKLAEAGADGLHVDKLIIYNADFNPAHGASPDQAVGEGELACLQEMLQACRAVNPEFCVSFEGWWDRLLSFGDVAWWGAPEESALKTAFPQVTACVGLTQPGDFNVVNYAALRGHHLLIGPGHYTRGADFPPMRRVIEYAGEVTRIRNSLLDCVSRGAVLPKSELTVAGAFASDTGAAWSVFRNIDNGRRAAVLINTGPCASEATDVDFAYSPTRHATLHQPFQQPRQVTLPTRLAIEGERLAILVEDAATSGNQAEPPAKRTGGKTRRAVSATKHRGVPRARTPGATGSTPRR